MKYKKSKGPSWGLLVFCLFSVLQGLSPAVAQCPIVVGGSDFVDKAHSDTIWAGDFNLLETKGPNGSKFTSQLPHADSAQAFMDPDQNVYAVTTNPHLLDSTYIDVDQNMLVVHIAENKASAIGATPSSSATA